MIVAGFDISKSVTGFAVTDGNAWESGAWHCPIKKPDGLAQGRIDAGYTAAVADWFDRQVFAFLGAHNPDAVAIEQPIPGNATKQKTVVDATSQWAGQALRKQTVGGTAFDVTHFLHGLVVVACRVCARKNIPPYYIASQTWRSTSGVGRPPKGIAASARRKWLKDEARRICKLRGIDVTGPDQAEACLLTLHLFSIMNPRIAAHSGELFRSNVA